MVPGQRRSELTRRILLINANTTAAITERLVAIAQAMAPPGVVFHGVTGRFGARYIASRASSAIAAHAAIDCHAEHGAGAAGVLLGCFGDPGLDALKELSPVPVLGLAEASAVAALRIAPRFGVVTGGAAWGPMLTEFFAGRGLGAALAGVRTVAPTGADIARDPDKAVALLAEQARASVTRDGAGVVVLGGAGLAGLAQRVAQASGVPVLCSVEEGVRGILAALGQPCAGLMPHAPVPTVGLSSALAARLE
jgi:Asp/Glu/hydantoin racemase